MTHALVLTDVVDSTKLAAELGDTRNGALWDAHDHLARALVARWNGTELERTDGIMASSTPPPMPCPSHRRITAPFRPSIPRSSRERPSTSGR